MEGWIVKKTGVWLLLIYLLAGCASFKSRGPEQVVPIALTIEAEDPQLASVNLNVFGFKAIDRLEDFNTVNLDLVDEPDSASILLNITIDRFTMFPPEQRISRRFFRRNIQVGTDANGKPVYQTVTASADIVQSRIRTSAFFNTNLTIRGTPGKTFERGFSENLNIDNVYVRNIQGDSRAVDPSIYSATMPPMEPLTDDIILALANKEMLDRLSREIRSYYAKH